MSKGKRAAKLYFQALHMGLVLIYVSLLVKFVPLRFYYSKYLENKGRSATGDMQLSANQYRLTKRMVELAPWKVSCLVESLAFHIYFGHTGIFVPVTLGVETGEDLRAHAWNFDRPGRKFAVINK